jgi:hypothetical protein
MANTRISELTASAALTGDEQVPVVQDAETVRTTIADILDLVDIPAGGTAWTDVGNLGSTEALGSGAKEGTADQACVITVALSDDESADLIVHQDATGGRAVTFTGVDSWVTAVPVTAGRAATTLDRFKFEQVDGVTYGYWITAPANAVIAGQDEGPTRTEASLGAAVSLLDSPFAVPAGLFRAGDVMEVTAAGTLTQNSGVSRVYTFTLLVGATALTIAINVSASATAVAFGFVARGRFEGVSDQNWSLLLNVSTLSKVDIGASAEDFGVAKVVDVKVASASVTATQSIQLTQASVRRIAA